MSHLRIAFFGSSLVSAYWNGAATYYRGIIRALSSRGHHVTFFEPDIYDRQKNRDIDDPPWAKVVVYRPEKEELWRALENARDADVLIKTSGIGIFDEQLEAIVPSIKAPRALSVFWDVDAPATLDRVFKNPQDPSRNHIPKYDLILTYGGGDRVVEAYTKLGARACVPIYNALDASTHYPVAADPRFAADLSLLANRLPDREARVEQFFLAAAERAPEFRFLLGGNGWQDKSVPPAVRVIGHVFTKDHNAFNCSARAVLNINRESMACYGFSPPTRIFEAAGAAACIISDSWQGIETFLEPEREVLVANDGDDVARILRNLTTARAAEIGAAAYQRVMNHHTYNHRVDQLESLLGVLRTPSSASFSTVTRLQPARPRSSGEI